MKKHLLFFALLVTIGSAAQTFTEISTPNILDVIRHGDIAWGDYDDDGDLDLLLTGQYGENRFATSRIYQNDGNDVFTDIMANILNLANTSVKWGDYDNDGDLDILMTGDTGFDPQGELPQAKSIIYRNDGNDTFIDINAGLFGVSNGAAAWGDYDNDGDLDVLLAGDSNFQSYSKIYRNDGNDAFTDILAPIQDVYRGSVSWADYDNDGDLDILLTGTSRDPNLDFSKLYRNVGNDNFVEVSTPWLPAIGDGSSVDWGDYDNDGDLDILISGIATTGIISTIYRNDGNDLFTDIQPSLQGVFRASSSWGDYDNDGNLDVLITGLGNSGGPNVPNSKVYRNNGNGNFTDIGAPLFNVHQSAAYWGDYDNDGDLDIIYTGTDGTNFLNGNGVVKLYRNNSTVSNTVPTAPTNVSGLDNGDGTLTITWDAATDNETPSAGLSYNILIKEDTDLVKSPMANESNGYRKVVRLGNAMQNTSYTLRLPQEYLCTAADFSIQVQAIDHAFTGSAFSQSATISISPADVVNIIYVNGAETAGGNGLSWETAYNNLQDAIDNVIPFCTNEIWVANGTYKPLGETTPFVIPEGIVLRGGFNGTETSADDRNCSVNLSILNGDLNNDNIPNAGDAHTIVQISNSNVTLDGFVIENSYADADDDTILPGRTGGAIYIRNDDGVQPDNIQVQNTVFRDNHVIGTGSVGVGAAVITYGTNVVFSNCLFHDNFSSFSGGAISPQVGNIVISNCTFAQNTAEIEGGAIHIFDALTSISNSIFAENTSLANPDINTFQGTNVTLSYSLLDGDYSTNGANGGTVIDGGNNLINTNPLFIGNGNFALQSTSPAINTGNNAVNATLYDLARANRIFDSLIDMGAFEDQGGMNPTQVTAICQDITVELNLNGMTSITAAQINNDSFANCGDITLSLDTTDFTCDDIGDNQVTLTATDVLGNIDTCTATVTVQDTNAPDITLYDLEVTLDANGMATITADDVLRRNGIFAVSKNVLGDPPVNLAFFDYDNNTDALVLNTEFDNFLPEGSNVYAIDGNPLNGQVYAIASIDPLPDVRILFEVDINDFSINTVGQIISSTGNVRPQDMAFSVDGSLYVLFEDGIIETYDFNTNASSTFANVGGMSSEQGLTYDFDNNRLLCVQESNPVQLFEVALPSGNVSPLFNFSTDAGNGPCAAQAIEYVGNNKVLVGSILTNGVLCDALYSVDLTTQMATILLNPTGTINEIQDLAYPWYGDICGEYSVSIDTTQFNCANVGVTNEVNLTFTDTAGNSSTSTVNITVLENPTNPCVLHIMPKVYLQGAALNPNSGEESLMRDDLRINDLIPLTSPYSDELIADASVFTATVGVDAIVDWVLVELRDATDPSIVINHKSGLLQRDGDIVDVDGVSTFFFNQAEGSYHIAIHHRNHLGIMTNSSLALSSTANTIIDFTDANSPITFGTNAQTSFGMPTGLLGMWAGNVNGDGIVRYLGANNDSNCTRDGVLADPLNIFNFVTFTSSGYLIYDLDLNGDGRFSGADNDTNIIRDNALVHPANIFGFPTYIITEQLPEN